MTFGLTRKQSVDIEGWGVSMGEITGGEQASVDPRGLFKNSAHPLEIELGSGKGTFLVQQADRQRDTNFLGIEWSSPFYRFAADRLRRHELVNTKMMHGDGAEFISFWCADAVATVLHLYFLDPWPKARHHKRRVVQEQTLQQFHRVLQPGGLVHLVTDHDQLWDWYQEHFNAASGLFEVRPFDSPESAEGDEVIGTNFERKYREQGRPIHSATLVRL